MLRPDWIIVPGGNLGNSSAFGKAFAELHELGLIDRIPRLAIVNATGANTLYHLYEKCNVRWNDGTPFTAEDVVVTFEDLIYNPDIPATARDTFTIDGQQIEVRALDTHTGVP